MPKLKGKELHDPEEWVNEKGEKEEKENEGNWNLTSHIECCVVAAGVVHLEKKNSFAH